MMFLTVLGGLMERHRAVRRPPARGPFLFVSTEMTGQRFYPDRRVDGAGRENLTGNTPESRMGIGLQGDMENRDGHAGPLPP